MPEKRLEDQTSVIELAKSVLDQNVIDRIAELIAAYQGERERKLDANLLAAQRQLAAKGMIGSGNTAHQFGRIGSDELHVRAGIIWNAIQRTFAAAGASADAATLRDLQQQLAHHINAQAIQVRSAAIAKVPPLSSSTRAPIVKHIEETIATKVRESVDQLGVEAAFYVEQVRRLAAQSPTAAPAGPQINFHGPVGAVQTGAYAVAHINLGSGAGDRLADALEALRRGLAVNAEASAEQRAHGDELAADLVAAVRADKPNAPKIGALLGGLATTVQTVASLRGAWDLVRDAVIAAGLGGP